MKKLYSIVVAFLMFFNLSLFAQDGPPWDFNGTDHGFVAQNYASLTVGDTYVTFTLTDADADGDAESPNSNFRNLDAGIDTSSGSFIAITMKNETANNKMQAILGAPGAGCGCYVNFETLSANDADFVTHYINVGANSNWTGTLSEIIFRFKKGNGVNNQTFAGDILIDHIEIVESIPATPRVDYTFDDTSDSEGFSGVNGITLTQPVAGELHLDIAAQSPYPKLEQTGLYSVDADTYKYVQVTLVNNSPKNKLTLVSPSGGNEYSTSDMVANDGVVQTYELDLNALTNWNGTQANWWLQLVENPGDGPVASAGIIDIQQILFATESIMPANVTFTVNMSNYIGGLAEGDIVYLNGDFYADSAWCGDCNPMTDNGDGTWSITLPIEAGTYDYKFTVNGWNNQEMWPGDGALSCPENTDDGQFENRSFTVADEDLTLETVFWNLCVGEEPAETFTVTFEVNTSSIVGGVGANGLYAGGGVLGNAQAVALSDDDGDGIWVGSIDLPAGSTGNYIFLNSPGDGGDWGAKENLEGQDCADPANFNDRILPEVTADVTYLACYGECSGDGTGECPAIGTTYMLTMTVNTANITVGENGMFVGGGVFGGSNGQAMSDDDGDGTWEVTVEVEEGFSGNYAFFNSPNGSSDWDTKENLEGQACADPANFNDRILEAVTADTTLMHCFGSCETDGSCPEGDPAMMLQGIIDFTVPSGGSDGKAIHLYVNEDIADLAQYGIGVANNGGGTDGQEYTFPTAAPTAGQHILVVRSVEAMDAYMNASAIFDHVFVDEGGSISQNGDDAIELYFLGGVVEVFGDIDVDGTGEAWEYLDSWAYKVNGDWTYGGVNCTDDSTTSCESSCPYPFAECSAGPCPAPDITSWSMTGDGAIFGGNNQDGVIGYQIEYSTSTFTPGDGTATIYEFDSFPHTLTGLESNTTYYFTIRSVCGDDNYSDWSDNGNDGPDAWTTTTCPSSYSLPYLNDFNDPVAWTTCQTFYDNDGDGNYWFYTTIDNSDNLTASSFSWNGSAFTPDNWVIMGPIDLTNVSDALLEWEVQALDPAYCNENYSVYVGPSNNYSDLLGSSVSYTETLESGGDACGSWANRSLDISAATGDLVYIGLRHHDVTDVYILSIDNVSVTSSTMSNEDFTLQNIDYSFDQETNLLRVTSEEMLSNIQIYNMLGQEVLSQDLNETSALLNLSSLSSSIYIVNVEGNNSKTKTFKLAIK